MESNFSTAQGLCHENIDRTTIKAIEAIESAIYEWIF
jgi:hypothetical protein